MKNYLIQLGSGTISSIEGLGKGACLTISALIRFFVNRRNWVSLIEQIHFMGVLSLPLIGMSAFFIGMVFTVQSYIVLEAFGAASEVGLVLAMSIFRGFHSTPQTTT